MTPAFCLAHLYSPAYFLPVVSAIVDRYGFDGIRIVVIIHSPGQTAQVRNQMHRAVCELAKRFTNIERVFSLSDTDVKLLRKQSTDVSRNTFHEMIGRETFNDCYYSHDFTSALPRIIHALFPSAKMICTGDALGIMYEPEAFRTYQGKGLLRQFLLPLRRCAKTIISSVIAHRNKSDDRLHIDISADLRPNSAVLILPIDATGGYIDQIPYTVCRKQTVLSVASLCATAATQELQGVLAFLDNRIGLPSYLLLLENHADARHMTFENEINMYVEIIRHNCSPGSLVILKPHPGEQKERGQALLAKLRNDFEVLILPETLKRYPVEILATIVERTQVIASAFPVISLRYLYGSSVIQPFDDTFIARWFPARVRPWLKDAHQLYNQAAENLLSWDGKSILWSATDYQKT